MKTERNYRVVGLEPGEDTYHVLIEVDGETVNTYSPPSEYLVPWLPRSERGILRRGMTATGRDRRPR